MRLHDHCRKPEPRFAGNNTDYWIGMELEVEAPTHFKRIAGLEIAKRPRYFYAKRDGSLSSYGWELVTHPISPNLWLGKEKPNNPASKVFALVKALKGLSYTSYDNQRCGLHLHVSRTAFSTDGSLKNKHYYWFCRLIHGKLFASLSQRAQSDLDCWAKQLEPKYFLRKGGNNSRYFATTTTPATVEVRIFRGNMREDRIRKAIESVVAAIKFSKTFSPARSQEKLDKIFARWVMKNETSFPNLASYLREINYVVKSEDTSEVSFQCA